MRLRKGTSCCVMEPQPFSLAQCSIFVLMMKTNSFCHGTNVYKFWKHPTTL